VPTFPNPVDGHIVLTPGSGIDPASRQFQAASHACASLAPSDAPPSGGSPAGSTVATRSTAPGAQWRAFDAWLKQRAAEGRFSGAGLVARDGSPILKAGYGMADHTPAIANTPQTKFGIASIGKLFTAVAIAQLAEQHKLAFDDTIGRYPTGLPPAIADHVTIAHLLTMTSGLDDVALARPNPPTTLAAMVKLIATEPPQFNPGSRLLYSNDGYIVLGAIVEHVSGQGHDRYPARLQPRRHDAHRRPCLHARAGSRHGAGLHVRRP
jgi:CubicO group peptidase (beta-lactamase class C family)